MARELVPTPPICGVCGDHVPLGAKRTESGAVICSDCDGVPAVVSCNACGVPAVDSYAFIPLCRACHMRVLTEMAEPAVTNNPGQDQAPHAPAHHEAVVPRATEESKGQQGSPCPAAGDRAGGEDVPAIVEILAEAGEVEISPLANLVAPPGVDWMIIDVEEWLYRTRPDLPESFQFIQETRELSRNPRELRRFPRGTPSSPEWVRFAVVLSWRRNPRDPKDPIFYDIGGWFTPKHSTNECRVAAHNAARTWAMAQARRLNLFGPIGLQSAREA